MNDKLEFVIYQYEGFIGQNSSILSTFITTYQQKNLNEEQIEFSIILEVIIIQMNNKNIIFYTNDDYIL